MVRKKVYTKEHILKASRDIVNKEGFSGLTARNIADKMSISTQPIYLEFQNMEDLKLTLLISIVDLFEKEFLYEKNTDDSVIDFGINFIRFSCYYPRLHLYLFVDNHGYAKHLHEEIFVLFKESVQNDARYQQYPQEQLAQLYKELLVPCQGLVALANSGSLELTQEYMVSVLQNVLRHSHESVILIKK